MPRRRMAVVVVAAVVVAADAVEVEEVVHVEAVVVGAEAFPGHPVEVEEAVDIPARQVEEVVVRGHPAVAVVGVTLGHPAAVAAVPPVHPVAVAAVLPGHPVVAVAVRGLLSCPPAADSAPAVVAAEVGDEYLPRRLSVPPVVIVARWAAVVLRNCRRMVEPRVPVLIVREIFRHKLRAGPEVWGRVVLTVPAQVRQVGLHNSPANPELVSQIVPAENPGSGQAAAMSGISLGLPVAQRLVARLAVPLVEASEIGLDNFPPIVPARVIGQGQGNVRPGPNSVRTGTSVRKAATTSGSNALIPGATRGANVMISVSRLATISSRIRINAGMNSIARGKTGKTGAIRTAKTGRAIARNFGIIAETGLRTSGITPRTSMMMFSTTGGGETAVGALAGPGTIP